MPNITRLGTRPLPRKAHPRLPRQLRGAVPVGTGESLTVELGGWAFQPRVYVAWDGPYAAAPAWIDVTEMVDVTAGITITTGRVDGLSDVNASTCTLTVDNSDGRWTPMNPSGAWAGLIRKGAWLRVDLIPLSGTVSRRFTGYLTGLPTTLTGFYADTQITASDIMVLVTQAPKLPTMIACEWLSDPVGAQYIAGYWQLHEPAGATYCSDLSGRAPVGAQALQVRTIGVTAGSGVTFSSAAAPGFDGQSTAVFAPSGGAIVVSSVTTGAHPSGSYLQGSIAMSGCAQVTCWIQTSTPLQPVWSWSDPATGYVLQLSIDYAGYLRVLQGPLGTGTGVAAFTSPQLSKIPLTDGGWHQVSIRLQTAAATPGGYAFCSAVVDGQPGYNFFGSNAASTGFAPSPTLTRFLLGGAEGWLAANTPSNLSMFTGALSDFVVHSLPSSTINPNWNSPAVAAITGHSGESTGLRVSRLVAYAGLPAPETAVTPPGTGLTLYQPTLGTTTAVNLGPTAHPAGVQTVYNQNALEMLRQVARTENMPLFVDAYGRLTLQASTIRENATASVTLSSSTDLDPSTAWTDDFQYTVNQGQVTPSGQSQVTVNLGGGTSQALFGVYPTQIDTASLNALEAASLGAALVAASANPPPRIAPLAVEAATLAQRPGYGAAWYDAVLALTVSSAVAVNNWVEQSPYGAGGSSLHLIEGWTETIGEGTHLIAWATSPARAPTYQCDSATLGLVDTPGITLAY
ncbi:hypothetical protein [Streptacidiphilus albus]|uniref:hypothetical protein n=1 Tax=Streptacidiphilus albus TaxID=105425 RepID=UPI00054BE152|nr:hypothetical protein [Streptacidiphilus albus]